MILPWLRPLVPNQFSLLPPSPYLGPGKMGVIQNTKNSVLYHPEGNPPRMFTQKLNLFLLNVFLEEILSLIMKTFLIFSAFKEKPTKTKQSHMHRFFFFLLPKASPELMSVLFPALVSWGGLPQRGCIWNFVNFTVLFSMKPSEILLSLDFCWGAWQWWVGQDPHTGTRFCRAVKVGYVLLSPHLHHLYMHFQNSFHFHKFLLTNIWVQPYGRKEYHKHDIFFLNSNIAVTLQQNGKRKKISLS